MVSVLVVGYKAFDLGIFGDKDQRLKIIKAAIRRDLIYLLENGMKWLVFTGNLGFEVWVLEVAKELQEKYKTGIILYRNSFSLASYEGKRDWLELGKRSRKSPAAATHPTGSWRVRENQISGKVVIDKQNNKNLV